MSFETHIKRIDKRDWNEIKNEWLQSLPIIEDPFKPPESQLADIPELSTIVKNVSSKGEYKIEYSPLRSEIFREAIFLFHKALNVSGITEENIKMGFNTWSLSNAYHCMFFSIKSILGFLGISIPRVNGIDYLVDIFPQKEELSKTKIKRGIIPEPTMKFLRFTNLKHYNLWRIFQRILNVAIIPTWNNTFIKYLLRLDPLDFARQRNSLHYQNNFWVYDDLFKPAYIEGTGYHSEIILLVDNSKLQELQDFTVIMSFIILSFAFQLMSDLSKIAPILDIEKNLIDELLQESLHSTLKQYLVILNE